MLPGVRIGLCIALLMSTTATASEATVKQAMQKKYPAVQVESVTKSPIAGQVLDYYLPGSLPNRSRTTKRPDVTSLARGENP
jgi:hypothetical protein